jgi:DNA repair protein RadC
LTIAQEVNACALILMHNHTSGQLHPSDNDRALTKKVKEAAEMFDISLLDHLIVTSDGYYSFADEGAL